MGSPALRRAADAYDRAQNGQISRPTRQGNQLRTAARLMTLTGNTISDTTLATVALTANLVALAIGVAELH